jgi:hypothetical protein
MCSIYIDRLNAPAAAAAATVGTAFDISDGKSIAIAVGFSLLTAHARLKTRVRRCTVSDGSSCCKLRVIPVYE